MDDRGERAAVLCVPVSQLRMLEVADWGRMELLAPGWDEGWLLNWSLLVVVVVVAVVVGLAGGVSAATDELAGVEVSSAVCLSVLAKLLRLCSTLVPFSSIV